MPFPRPLARVPRLAAAFALLGTAATVTAAPSAGTATAPATPAAGPALEWVPKYEDALARAKKERKLVLLDFYTDWCGWCKRLDKDVFAVPAFQKEAAGVLGVKINAERLPELAQKYGVTSYPKLFVLDPDGTIVERIRGYLSLQDFTAKIQQVRRGDTEFARLREAANDPANVPAIQRFARLLSDGGQADQAIAYWQQVHDASLEQVFQNPANQGAVAFHREALVELGKSYSSVGLADVARQHFQETVAAYPGSREAAEAVFGMAQLEMKAPGCGRSAALLQQVVQEYGFTPVARQAQLLLPRAQACSTSRTAAP